MEYIMIRCSNTAGCGSWYSYQCHALDANINFTSIRHMATKTGWVNHGNLGWTCPHCEQKGWVNK